jgi:hypothetical protein
MKPPAVAEPSTPETGDTGLPWFRTWRGVYLFVFGCFILWVALLFALTRIFS